MSGIRDNRGDALKPGESVYGPQGEFLGQFVNALSDPLMGDEDLRAIINGEPYGKTVPRTTTGGFGIPVNVYGERRVWTRSYGTQKQFLVRSFDGGPFWMNVRDNDYFVDVAPKATIVPQTVHPTIALLLNRISQLPGAERVRVFGSVAAGKADPEDLDIVFDASDCADRNDAFEKHGKILRALLSLAKRNYGWLDPFFDTKTELMVRSDDAAGWTRSARQREMRAATSEGVPIAQIIERLQLAPAPDTERPGRSLSM